MQTTNEISAREAAKRLGVGLSHLYQLLWTGKLDGHKRDGSWHVSAQAIQARLNARSAAGTNEARTASVTDSRQ